MSAYFEIAYAAASGRLCLFTGTGFSKAVTQGAAPNWQELLERCCDTLANGADLKAALFPVKGNNPLALEEAAQVISIELSKCGKSIYEEICSHINGISLSGDNSAIQDVLHKHSVSIITTNYDKLAEALIGDDRCHSLTPGLPIPRSRNHAEVYHVHGSIDSPDNMVVTSDDYFRFINSESYFSRKLSTVLHENTVVILGYSLSDTNLKAIISDYKGLSFKQIVSGNIFLVSRNAVSQYVKDYYSHCYGMRVIDGTEIADFFKGVSASVVDAEKCKDATVNLRNVLNNGYHYTDDYIKISSSLYEIIAAVGAIGKSVNDQKVVSVLADIIEKKRAFTQGIGAWDQYVHLARWLVYIAGIVDIASLTIKDKYLASALHSMNTMSKSLTKGYSWHAYDVWDAGWSNISSANRAIIATHIRATCMNADALGVVNRP